MGQQPSLIGGIAVKSIADMIPYSAQTHGFQRLLNHIQGVLILIAIITSHQEQQPVRCWKLGSRLKAAILHIKSSPDVSICRFKHGCIRLIRCRKGKGPVQAGGNAGGRCFDFFYLLRPEVFDLAADID